VIRAVLYRSRMNPSLGRNFDALDPLEWLARMSDHIPDPGQHRTLFYGRPQRPPRASERPRAAAFPPNPRSRQTTTPSRLACGRSPHECCRSKRLWIHLEAPLEVAEPGRAEVPATALEYGATVYDAVYIALSRSLDLSLLTAERTTTPWLAKLGRRVESVRER
jgi:hypothetical protein